MALILCRLLVDQVRAIPPQKSTGGGGDRKIFLHPPSLHTYFFLGHPLPHFIIMRWTSPSLHTYFFLGTPLHIF